MSGALVRPSKLIAVHLNYRSRAAERGKSPANPSYFLKAPSTITTSGAVVERPAGTRLLALEGEIAVVIGTRARRVGRADAWSHVGSVTAANDFGVYDLRYADPGSNVHSKGFDGFTPIGPELIDAAAVEPGDLHLRTWVNGEIVQDALTSEDMLFDPAFVIADLSRMMTLEPGDVILMGTPTGSSVVEPGDVVEVEVTAGDLSSGRLRSPIGTADHALDEAGALPRVDEATLDAAYGAGGIPESALALHTDRDRDRDHASTDGAHA
ncbi:2-keto-4-pentenoate hydratase/2-oxohepta-3-ene-1,7-dioic acid hydratase in catechol pathway [Curtobacterium pusillum]|uniref:2-keto-4-pentenoate hydratase/2-oxohepta-3-ene-1,7-dioic acid hydratase in catechol pathway n=1 Tax=Curtobacterium pusillum TaxID=69373 RepID=A0AAW3T7X0_9MICO|nr:fumarylacetoacetate hydrolase family protein [Curtobacterium pusillum]MBA8991153.1 2-keto-4-pentenoate hydratase/2-oxohepta-3-ene-1,7-dioic acid hydratase in catechol pathway [Curtobacterium pusillum]